MYHKKSDFWTGWKDGVASPYPIFCNLHDMGMKSRHKITPVGQTQQQHSMHGTLITLYIFISVFKQAPRRSSVAIRTSHRQNEQDYLLLDV